jgi:hypothetical protein
MFFTPSDATFKIKTKADVAQLVEQPIRNRQVIGSSPIVGSILQRRSSLTTHVAPICARQIPVHLVE